MARNPAPARVKRTGGDVEQFGALNIPHGVPLTWMAEMNLPIRPVVHARLHLDAITRKCTEANIATFDGATPFSLMSSLLSSLLRTHQFSLSQSSLLRGSCSAKRERMRVACPAKCMQPPRQVTLPSAHTGTIDGTCISSSHVNRRQRYSRHRGPHKQSTSGK